MIEDENGKQIKRKNPNNTGVIGKGNVTPAQVAFIVDRYLADNNFSRTRSAFHSQASSLIFISSIGEVPKSLMSLDEYIWFRKDVEVRPFYMGCKMLWMFITLPPLSTVSRHHHRHLLSPPSLHCRVLRPSHLLREILHLELRL